MSQAPEICQHCTNTNYSLYYIIFQSLLTLFLGRVCPWVHLSVVWYFLIWSVAVGSVSLCWVQSSPFEFGQVRFCSIWSNRSGRGRLGLVGSSASVASQRGRSLRKCVRKIAIHYTVHKKGKSNVKNKNEMCNLPFNFFK